MKFLLVLFFFFLLMIFITGFSLIKLIFNLLFGKRHLTQDQNQSERNYHTSDQKKSTNQKNDQKVFSKEEGEYVDFEEI